MAMKIKLLVVLLLAALPQAAAGTCYLSSECNGTTVDLFLSVFNDLGEQYEGLNVIVKQREVGTCAPEVVVDGPVITMPGFPSGFETEFSVTVAQTDLYYCYSAYVVMPDESHQFLAFASHETGCGVAIAGRGYLTQETVDPILTFTSCGNECWDGVLYDGAQVWVFELPSEEYLWAVGTGIPVDLFGTAGPPVPMPGDPQLFLTSVQPTPEGDCDALGLDSLTLDSLKARYR
jgi:hypothetical protein